MWKPLDYESLPCERAPSSTCLPAQSHAAAAQVLLSSQASPHALHATRPLFCMLLGLQTAGRLALLGNPITRASAHGPFVVCHASCQALVIPVRMLKSVSHLAGLYAPP